MIKKKSLTDYEIISQHRIKSLINGRCNGSQREFATRTGLNIGSVSQYVNGKNTPSSKSAQKIADAFGVKAEWVMGFESQSMTYHSRPRKYKINVRGPRLSDFAHTSKKVSLSDITQNQIIFEKLSNDEKNIITLYREGKYKEIVRLMMEKI